MWDMHGREESIVRAWVENREDNVQAIDIYMVEETFDIRRS